MGLTEIKNAFARAKAEGRPALMPYWTLGYPDVENSLKVIEAIARAGADMIELGIPFSDPLADGAVIQQASQIALAHGVSVRQCLELTNTARARGVKIPLMAMGYMNPIMAHGEKRYAEDWHTAQADGLIVPDLPPEEATDIKAACDAHDMALVQFVAPTSTVARMTYTVQQATGFVYVVQVTGVTGARDKVAEGLGDYVARVKAVARGTPVAVGFGVSKREHVREIGQYADGVIVGAALIRAAGTAADPAQAAYAFVRELMS